MSVKPDQRAKALSVFRRVSAALCLGLAIVAILHGVTVTAPQIIQAMSPTELDTYRAVVPEVSALVEEPGPLAEKDLVKTLLADDPIRSDYVYLSVLNGITTLQLAAGSLLFALLARRSTNPFSRGLSRCMLALACLVALQVAVKWAFVDGFIYTNYSMIPLAPSYYPAMFRPLHIIDLPSCLLATVLFAMSVLFRYGDELYTDTEEMA